MDSWLAQARRGIVELCVLALIQQRPRYGYELSTLLGEYQPLATTEGTLYPLLRRLQREHLLEALWEESQDGPPRKYYRLTEQGTKHLEAQTDDWQRLSQAVASLTRAISMTNEDEEVPNGSGSRRHATLPGPAAREPEPATRR